MKTGRLYDIRRGVICEGMPLTEDGKPDLWGANLAHADLSGAYLEDANLAGAYLENAILTRANLMGAYLDGADLMSAYLEGANFADANLTGADLSGANLNGANLADADLTNAILPKGYGKLPRGGIMKTGPLLTRWGDIICQSVRRTEKGELDLRKRLPRGRHSHIR